MLPVILSAVPATLAAVGFGVWFGRRLNIERAVDARLNREMRRPSART